MIWERTPTPPVVVLDTNVVLDCLLFQDPGTTTLRAALQAGQLRWVVCARMREEFRRTLQRDALSKWQPDSEHLLTLFDRHATLRPDPPAAPLRLRCDDANDQVFIDLALASGAAWLLSHDKAVLRLRRRVPAGGPRICRPADWPGLPGA
ncbi:MAG: putative toxin-antitoxin system toxin component, PIN family [Rubrivivax sp.]|nr:putative toxin-antitoxin system toxin component, PIN family [Rubrivivax sp.]